jgi:hypothetical protein
MELKTERYISKELISLLEKTSLGTNGAVYKHLDIKKQALLTDNPLSLLLIRNQKLIGNITFCERPFGFYLRYFTFESLFQNSGKSSRKSKGNSPIKKEIHQFFETCLIKKGMLYAYIDPNNKRSLNMAETFGLEIKSLLTTQAYSRFFPKMSRRFRLVEDWKEIKDCVESTYGTQFGYTDTHICQGPYGAVYNKHDELIAFAKFNKATWEIERFPGKYGKLIPKVLPYIPLLKKIINPKKFSFLVPDIVWVDKNNPNLLTELFNAALNHYACNSIIWWTDENQGIYQAAKAQVKWGLLHRLLGNNPLALVQKSLHQEIKEEELIFVNGFDLI